MKLTKHQKVPAALTDTKANLSVMGIFQIVEEAITELMGELKLDDIISKKKYNAIWVFTKNKIEIHKDIAWNKEYTCISFISKITPISICIDIGIKNDSDELCMYSRANLCALDLHSGKIRKVSTVGVDDNMKPLAPITEITFTKSNTDKLTEAAQIKVKYTNIDFAGHTNNKEYIRFILDTYSVRELETCPIREIEVFYINQSYENDILTVKKGNYKDKEIFTVQKGDTIIVKCEIVRNKRDTP